MSDAEVKLSEPCPRDRKAKKECKKKASDGIIVLDKKINRHPEGEKGGLV